MNSNWKNCVRWRPTKLKTLSALPKPLRERARELPVTLERVPNAGLQADGIEPDTLGLFTGPDSPRKGTFRCRRRLAAENCSESKSSETFDF